jgi:hypothetical protein
VFALVLALCCLLITVVSSGWAASLRPPTAKLAVYLKTEASQSARALDSMKQELSRLMQTAGYQLEWRGPQDSHIDTGAFLAVVELRGDCEAPLGNLGHGSTLPGIAELASTFVSDGQVLPFSWVNCGNVTKLLAPALFDQPAARRDFILGRAVARLIAHEFYHMLMQTREHTRNGISKASFTAADLLTNSFDFEGAALAQLQRSQAGRVPDLPTPASTGASSSTDASEPASGRVWAR